MDLGFHSVISRALMLHVSADQGRCRQVLNNAELLSHIIHSMDSRADKQKFLEQYHSAFMIPKRLEFQAGPQEDLIVPNQKETLPNPSLTQLVECELQKTLGTEMDQRLAQLSSRTNHLKAESDEIWKTLETAEINLLEILNTKVVFLVSLKFSALLTHEIFYRITMLAGHLEQETQEVTIIQCKVFSCNTAFLNPMHKSLAKHHRQLSQLN